MNTDQPQCNNYQSSRLKRHKEAYKHPKAWNHFYYLVRNSAIRTVARSEVPSTLISSSVLCIVFIMSLASLAWLWHRLSSWCIGMRDPSVRSHIVHTDNWYPNSQSHMHTSMRTSIPCFFLEVFNAPSDSCMQWWLGPLGLRWTLLKPGGEISSSAPHPPTCQWCYPVQQQPIHAGQYTT